MKVHPFTMLVPYDKSAITERITTNYFYQFLHRHDEWQLTWVEEGEGTLIAGNSMHDFAKDDIFLLGANLPHLFKSNPEYFDKESTKSITACSVYFNPNGLLRPLFSLPEMNNINNFFKEHQHGFKVPKQNAQPIKDALLKMHYAEGAEAISNFLVLLQAILNIDSAIEPICSPMFSSKISENEGIRLSKIINYITENYQTQITLEDVASFAYMTPQAFCRYFKKHTKHTFVSFLNEVRINDACKQLTNDKTQRSMVDIAYASGFSSITNFNRVFKSVTGKSPKAYIDAFKNVSRVVG